jgi:hypothetical protein
VEFDEMYSAHGTWICGYYAAILTDTANGLGLDGTRTPEVPSWGGQGCATVST